MFTIQWKLVCLGLNVGSSKTHHPQIYGKLHAHDIHIKKNCFDSNAKKGKCNMQINAMQKNNLMSL
jgi:hypothetical protein